MTSTSMLPPDQDDGRHARLGPMPASSRSTGSSHPLLTHPEVVIPSTHNRTHAGVTPEPGTAWQGVIGELLDKPESSLSAQVVHYILIFVILASTVAVIVETMPEMHMNPFFFPFEMCITAFFTLEFALRCYSADSFNAFISNGFNVVDLFAIFPGYIELLLLLMRSSPKKAEEEPEFERVQKAVDSMQTLRMIRMIRLVRVFRVLRIAKVARHSQLLSIILSVFLKVFQSGLVVVLTLICFAMILSASLIYIFESEFCEEGRVQCNGPSSFVSIPAAFWWSISTLTTVGYGDMVPHTVAGEIIGSLTAVTGIIVVAIGITLVPINFRESFLEEQAKHEQRRKGGPTWPESRPREERELQQLLETFEQRTSVLQKKLHDVARNQGEAHRLLPLLDVMSSHSDVLISDVRIFIDQVLSLYDTQTALLHAALQH